MPRGRRGAGEGTIYQRATDGIWCAQATGPDGRRRSVYGRTREIARQRLVELQRTLAEGGRLDAAKVTLGDYSEIWLTRATANTRALTAEMYRNAFANHILPGIGAKRRLVSITRGDVESWTAGLTRAGLAASTVWRLHGTLSSMMSGAVDDRIIPANPALRTKRPEVPDRSYPITDPAMARAILDAAGPDLVGTAVGLALLTGLRQGEILGIIWPRDIDLDAGRLRVREQAGRWAGPVKPKTKAGPRNVPLVPEAVDRIRAWVEATSPAPGTPLFQRDGKHLTAAIMRHAFVAWRKEHGFGEYRFHDLRHGYATLLLSQGVALSVIRDLLGHASISITARIYAHVIPQLYDDARDALHEATRRRDTP